MARRTDDEEPPAKRVRFGESTDSVDSPNRTRFASEAEHGGDAAHSVGQGEIASAAKTLDACSVVELRFVSKLDDIHPDGARGQHDPKLTAHPTFTHQIFPGGVIHGVRQATAAMYYTCSSLSCWLDVYTVDMAGKDDQEVVSARAGSVPNANASNMRDMLWKQVTAGGLTSRVEFEAAAAKDLSFQSPFDVDPVLIYERGDRTFSVFKHQDIQSSPAVADYHKRMQLLMFMHIDGASFIDDSDSRWELFVIQEHINGVPRHFVGYATVYPFCAMRPGSTLDAGFGERIRISQVFILPRFQRGGHGGKLLTAIYEDALKRNAIEVTVEDPSEGFRLLRDTVDVRRAYKKCILDPKRVDDGDCADAVASMRSKLLLTKSQARRCLEVHKLRFVDRSDEDGSYKRYRLWVKRRLYDEYLEVLDAFSGNERKSKLAEIYEDYEKEYLLTCSRLKRKEG